MGIIVYTPKISRWMTEMPAAAVAESRPAGITDARGCPLRQAITAIAA